jgi:hypothetical protein
MSFPNASVPALFAPTALPAPLLTTFALMMVATVLALVAWALQLMQAASERREFALMLAGCMVCSAAVGLATVMVITISGPGRLEARGLGHQGLEVERGVSLDAIVLPWDQPSTTPNARS